MHFIVKSKPNMAPTFSRKTTLNAHFTKSPNSRPLKESLALMCSRVHQPFPSEQTVVPSDHVLQKEEVMNGDGNFKIEVCNYIKPTDPRSRQLEPRTEQLGGRLKNKSRHPKLEDISREKKIANTLGALESGSSELFLNQSPSAKLDPSCSNQTSIWRSLLHVSPEHLARTTKLLKAVIMQSPTSQEKIMQSPVTQEMALWLEFGAKGESNIMRACPDAPMSPSFQSPSAPCLRTEVRTQDDELDSPWVRAIEGAMQTFGTSTAGYSLVNGEFEAFQAEESLRINKVPFRTSITAQALDSEEVFVILDVSQDTRFMVNPIDNENPQIRFLAATPLFLDDRKPYGVFWISDSKPRSQFLPSEQRELTELASKLMDELRDTAESSCSSPSFRTTPLLQRDSLIYGKEYRQQDMVSSTHSPTNDELVPIPLNLNKRNQIPQKTRNGQLTPPSSSESNHNTYFDKFEQGRYGQSLRDPKPSIMMSVIPPSLLVDEEEIPDMPKSDLKDGRLERHEEDSVDVFFGMRDDECFEQIEQISPKNANSPSLPTKHQDKESFGNANQASSTSSTSSSTLGMKPIASNIKPIGSKNAKSSFPPPATNQNEQSFGIGTQAITASSSPSGTELISSNTEPTLAQTLAQRLARKAQNLKFDMMYLVEIKPVPENKWRGGQPRHTIRFISAYGLEQKYTANLEMHLNALRQKAPYIFDRQGTPGPDNQYKHGVLVTVTAEGHISNRNYGVILGAFREGDAYINEELSHRKLRNAKDRVELVKFAEKLKPDFPKPGDPTDISIPTNPIRWAPAYNFDGRLGIGANHERVISSSNFRREVSDPTSSMMSYDSTRYGSVSHSQNTPSMNFRRQVSDSAVSMNYNTGAGFESARHQVSASTVPTSSYTNTRFGPTSQNQNNSPLSSRRHMSDSTESQLYDDILRIGSRLDDQRFDPRPSNSRREVSDSTSSVKYTANVSAPRSYGSGQDCSDS